MKKLFLLAFALIFFSFLTKPQVKAESSIYLDIPVFDFYYQSLAAKTAANHRNSLGAEEKSKAKFSDFISSYSNPSMDQSLNWSSSWLSLVGYGVNKSSDMLVKPGTRFKSIVNQSIRELTFTTANLFLIYFPLADGWVHEEFHRAVMATNKVHSYDNINSFNSLGQGHISVTRIKDEDLAYFKKNDPAGFNRMLVAGGEGDILLTRKLQLGNFYYNSDLPITLYNILITFLITNYPKSDAQGLGNEELLERESKETKISARDFTGPDYSGWVWHLFKPNAPYSSLGNHVTGVGIDRYKSSDDLTDEELKFLKKAAKIMSLNFVSPMIVGFYQIPTWKNHYVNFALRTFLNGFGYDINPEIYYKTANYNLYLGIHNYQNYQSTFYGIEFGGYKNKFKLFNKELMYDARLIVWQQPKNQEFKTNKSNLGGLIGGKIYYPIYDWMNTYIGFDAKSKGWVAGNPYLKRNFSVSAGFAFKIRSYKG